MNIDDIVIRIAADVAGARRDLRNLDGSLSSTAGVVAKLGKAMAALATAAIGGSIISDLVRIKDEAVRLESAYKMIFGTAERAAGSLQFVSEVANTAGVSLGETARAFQSLAAASKGTALEGQATRDIFKTVSLTMAKLGKDTFDTAGALKALEQMISKGCYDEETDVYTDRGWVSWTDVKSTDRFLTINLKTEKKTFQRASRLIKYRHRGKMYRVRSGLVDLLVTPDHRMVVRKDGDLTIIRANELKEKPYIYHVEMDETQQHEVDVNDTQWVDFDGDVYCAEVPNGTLLIRRNGKICWSGNSVQTEELRGQLGERLPGAYSIAARAMGVTSYELSKMLEMGQVTAEEMLPKLRNELERMYGSSAVAETVAADFERLKNTIAGPDGLGVAINDAIGLNDSLSSALKSTTESVEGLNEAIRDGTIKNDFAGWLETMESAENLSKEAYTNFKSIFTGEESDTSLFDDLSSAMDAVGDAAGSAWKDFLDLPDNIKSVTYSLSEYMMVLKETSLAQQEANRGNPERLQNLEQYKAGLRAVTEELNANLEAERARVRQWDEESSRVFREMDEFNGSLQGGAEQQANDAENERKLFAFTGLEKQYDKTAAAAAILAKNEKALTDAIEAGVDPARVAAVRNLMIAEESAKASKETDRQAKESEKAAEAQKKLNQEYLLYANNVAVVMGLSTEQRDVLAGLMEKIDGMAEGYGVAREAIVSLIATHTGFNVLEQSAGGAIELLRNGEGVAIATGKGIDELAVSAWEAGEKLKSDLSAGLNLEAEAAKKAAKETEKAKKEIEDLSDEYGTLESAERARTKALSDIERLTKDNRMTEAERARAIADVGRAYQSAHGPMAAYFADLEESATDFGTIAVDAMDSFRYAVIDGLANSELEFEDFVDDVKYLLAELAINTIYVNIVGNVLGINGGNVAGSIAGSVAGGNGGGIGGSLSSLGSVGRMFGGNSIGSSAASGLGWSLDKVGLANNSFAMGSMSNLAATPNWAMGVGSIGGSLAGNALFGNKGYGSIGSTVGSTAGSLAGAALIGQTLIPIPGVGAIVGGILGGIAGGALGSIFGNGTPRQGNFATSFSGRGFEDNVSARGAFGLNFGLQDKGSDKIKAAEYQKTFDSLATVSNAVSQFYGVDLSNKIQSLLRDRLGDFNGWGKDLDQSFKHMFTAILDAANEAEGNVGDGMGHLLKVAVGDLSGTAEQMAGQLEAGMMKVNAAISLFGTDIGKQLGMGSNEYYNTLESSIGAINGYVARFGQSGESFQHTLERIITGVVAFDQVAAATSTSLEGVNADTLIQLGQTLMGTMGEMGMTMDMLSGHVAAYNDKFYSEEEKAEITRKNAMISIDAWNNQIGRTGDSAIKTSDGFRAYIESLDLLDPAQHAVYLQAMQMVPAFVALEESMDDVNKTMKENVDKLWEKLLPKDYQLHKMAEFKQGMVDIGLGAVSSIDDLVDLQKAGLLTSDQIQFLADNIDTLGDAADEARKKMVATTDHPGFESTYEKTDPTGYAKWKKSKFDQELVALGGWIGMKWDDVTNLFNLGKLSNEQADFAIDNLEMFPGAIKEIGKAANGVNKSLAGSSIGGGGGAGYNDSFNSYLTELSKSGVSETARLNSLIDTYKARVQVANQDVSLLYNWVTAGMIKADDKRMIAVRQMADGAQKSLNGLLDQLADAMPLFASEIQPKLIKAEADLARWSGLIQAAVESGGTYWDGRTGYDVAALQAEMEKAAKYRDLMKKEYDDSVEFYDDAGINVALKKLERARNQKAAAKTTDQSMAAATSYSAALYNLKSIIDPLIDEFITSLDVSDDLQKAVTSIKTVFAGLNVDIPLTGEAFKTLHDSGRMSVEQMAKLATKLEDLGVVINAASELMDWLKPVETQAQALATMNKVFADMGKVLPATKDALYAMVTSGALTSNQVLELIAHFDSLQLVFDDTGDAATEAADALQSLFDSLISSEYAASLAAVKTAFDQSKLAIQPNIDALKSLYDAGKLSAQQIEILGAAADDLAVVYAAVSDMTAWAKPAKTLAEAQAGLSETFASLGLTVPATKAAFYTLLTSGKLTATQTLALAGEMESLVTVFDDVETRSDAARSSLDSLAQTLLDLADSMSTVSADIARTQRVTAQAQIADALAGARAGVMPADGALDSAIEALRQDSQGLFGSYAEYAYDMAKTRAMVYDLGRILEGGTAAVDASDPDEPAPVSINADSFVPLQQSQQAMTDEIKALRRELAESQSQLHQVQTSIAIHTSRSARILDDWDGGGLPVERVETA